MNDRDKAILWAQAALEDPRRTYIFDTETTGLERDAQIVSIAVINGAGDVLFNSLVKPTIHIPVEVTAIHGITDQMVQYAPPWEEVWSTVRVLFEQCERLVSYNSAFDWRMVWGQCKRLGLLVMPPKLLDCAMLNYAAYYNQWDYKKGGWKWQRLRGGDHTALGDCRATLDLMYDMANTDTSEESQKAKALQNHQYQIRPESHAITDRNDPASA